MSNVNSIQIDGAAAGTSPAVGAIGADTDVDYKLYGQGAGIIALASPLGGSVSATKPLTLAKATVTPASDADVTLLAAQYRCPYVKIVTGAWTGNKNVVVPTVDGAIWLVVNTSSYQATVKTAAGTGIAIATTKTALVMCDGTNVIRITADA